MHKYYKLLKANNPKHEIVILEEEYGYRRWFWFTQMTSKELESWWKRQNRMYKLDFISKFPGKLLEATSYEKTRGYVSYNHKYETDMFNNSIWYYDYYLFDWLYEKWEKLNNSYLHYTAHVFCDDDSWLISPKGNRIHHNGYYPARNQTELDIKYYIAEDKSNG